MKEYGSKQICGKDAQYLIYYVMEQNRPSGAFIAVVGVDYSANRSQHYKYFSCNDVHKGRLLYSKSKVEVKKWLQQVMGAAVAAHQRAMARISEPTEATIQQLLLDHSNTSVADSNVVAKIKLLFTDVAAEQACAELTPEPEPELEVRIPEYCAFQDLPDAPAMDDPSILHSWSRWMEVENIQDAGGWCRRFLLLDDSLPERQLVAITVVEVDPKNQTFFYQATEQLGAHCFTCRREAIAWISKHFIKSWEDTVTAPKQPKGPSTEHAALACGLDVLHWAVQQPAAEVLDWAVAVASQLKDIVEGAVEGQMWGAACLEEQRRVACELLTELAGPKVNLLLLAQCSDLAAAVVHLQQHAEPEIAQKAQQLARSWAEKAELVERLTQDAMQEDGYE